MYRKYRIVECIASSVSQYESYRDQVYRNTPNLNQCWLGPGYHMVSLGHNELNSNFYPHTFNVQWIVVKTVFPDLAFPTIKIGQSYGHMFIMAILERSL